MNTLQFAALMYLITYIGVLICFRSYLLYKRTGINPFTSKKKTGKEGFVAKVLAVCFFLIIVVVANFVFIEINYKFLVPITYLENSVVATVGIFLGFFGLAIGFIAQLQMGDSWRLAFNENERTTLVNNGLYAYSRNPIYLGYLISLVGFFFMMPNAISLCILVTSCIAIEIKIRLEEVYLKRVNGRDFEDYMNRVRRWI